MRLTVRYGERAADYEVRENGKLTTRLRIHVEPDGQVVVEAPTGAGEAQITAGVQKRARWIMSHIDQFEEFRRYALPREYKSGETHFYLGRRYKLKPTLVEGARPFARLVGGRIEVVVRSEDEVRRALGAWYRQRAAAYFSGRSQRLAAGLPWVEAPPPIKLLKMRRYWGSCSPRGAVTLNPALVKAPVHCIDYVLLHELCHLEEHNHSPKFYALLDRYMPDWRHARRELDTLSELLLVS